MNTPRITFASARGALAAVAALAAAASFRPASARDLAETNLLTSRYSVDAVGARLLPREAWEFMPPAANRAAWDRVRATELGQQREKWIVGRAEKLLGAPWPALPATLFMEFKRSGNRANYEKQYFARRQQLATLVLAECFENQGRFIDEIVNGLSVILEETTWGIPATSTFMDGDSLHRPDLYTVDLFAAETAMNLALVRHLLRDEITRVSPGLIERIRRDVLRRVIEPVETSDTFGMSIWLTGLNNWSPWCSSNVLGSAMLLLDDTPRLARLSVRLMGVVDKFIDRYGDDGGCDEGPGYWNEAPGAMLVFLELLRGRTDGFVDLYAHPKVAAMGRFIVSAHIAGPWFVNFTDADARTGVSSGRVYRYAERVNDPAMRRLALLGLRKFEPAGPIDPPLSLTGINRAVLGPLMDLFWMPPDAAPVDDAPTEDATVWLPDLNVLFAREHAVRGRGLFLAAKGGHNAESHNHNDTGHFIVFLDGQPGLIDVGRETYSAATFGPERYDLWFTRGNSHNAPVVNGVEQVVGADYKATEVVYALADGTHRLGMNLEQSYPESAGLKSLRRDWTFATTSVPQATIRVRDQFALKQGPAEITLNFYSLTKPELIAPGRVALPAGARRLLLEFSPDAFATRVEVRELSDPIMRRNWGERLWHIVLVHRSAESTGSYELTLRAES